MKKVRPSTLSDYINLETVSPGKNKRSQKPKPSSTTKKKKNATKKETTVSAATVTSTTASADSNP